MERVKYTRTCPAGKQDFGEHSRTALKQVVLKRYAYAVVCESALENRKERTVARKILYDSKQDFIADLSTFVFRKVEVWFLVV
jgi:endonuclease YncB( thermonuclease family)